MPAISPLPFCNSSTALLALATCTTVWIDGNEVFNSFNICGNRNDAFVMLEIILIGVSSSKWLILRSNLRQSVRIFCDCANREAPHGVKTTPFDKRSKSAVPACFSSSATACGGAGLVQQLIRGNCIDEYYITVIPTLLGSGIKLFECGNQALLLKLTGTRSYNGMVDLIYSRRW